MVVVHIMFLMVQVVEGVSESLHSLTLFIPRASLSDTTQNHWPLPRLPEQSSEGLAIRLNFQDVGLERVNELA